MVDERRVIEHSSLTDGLRSGEPMVGHGHNGTDESGATTMAEVPLPEPALSPTCLTPASDYPLAGTCPPSTPRSLSLSSLNTPRFWLRRVVLSTGAVSSNFEMRQSGKLELAPPDRVDFSGGELCSEQSRT